MTLIAVEDATTTHTGTICGGAVAGTVTVGSNTFVFIGTKKMMVANGTLEVPTHNNPPCVPPNNTSHSFTPNTFAQSFVTIGAQKVVLVNDSYSGDATSINSAGTNSFVQVV